MIVVSDTSAISNLFQIGLAHLLKDIYSEVIISPGVQRELFEFEDQVEFLNLSSWIKVRTPEDQKFVLDLINERDLDLGESESIALALEVQSDYLIIDERLGRKIAEGFGLRIIGILGILLIAKRRGFIDSLKDAIKKLQEINFRLHPKLIERVLSEAGEK